MIKLYILNESTATFDEISSVTFAAPVLLATSPGGSPVTKKVYIRNTDATKYYTDIRLRPTSTIGAAITSTAVSIKLLSGDKEPAENRWASVAPNGPGSGDDPLDPNDCAVLQSPLVGGAIDTRLPELGSAGHADTKYYPFWVRVSCTRGCPQGDLNFALEIEYTEHLV